MTFIFQFFLKNDQHVEINYQKNTKNEFYTHYFFFLSKLTFLQNFKYIFKLKNKVQGTLRK